MCHWGEKNQKQTTQWHQVTFLKAFDTLTSSLSKEEGAADALSTIKLSHVPKIDETNYTEERLKVVLAAANSNFNQYLNVLLFIILLGSLKVKFI